MVLLSKAQKDPSVWGDDADEFKPERMLDEPFDEIMAQYPGSWKVSCSHEYQADADKISPSVTASELVLDDPSPGKNRC